MTRLKKIVHFNFDIKVHFISINNFSQSNQIMSLEPSTTAKARLNTTKGAIDIELWAKETPITSRIFLTNILNQKFNGWLFNRIIPNFIAQVDGVLNQEPFQDEFNTRIRFNRRGLLGSVNLDTRNSNTGKFFITLKETSELNNRNTMFGKVVGDSIFNVIKISEGELSEDGETPLYPVKILSSEVLVPYFEDLKKEEFISVKEKVPIKKSKQKKKNKVKLNYGEDGEEEDVDQSVKIKMKSAHELLNDKKLSKEEASIDIVEPEQDHPSVLKEKENAQDKTIDRDVQLQEIRSQIDNLKSSLNNDETKEIEEKESIIDQERNKYLSKNPTLKVSKKSEKELRELETLKLLKSFKEKVEIKKPSPSEEKHTKKPKPTKEPHSDKDDDFDNLDDSDSDSDIDLYSHALKFDDNEKNKALANEDLLITIDESKDKELKKRRNDDFYRNEKTTSILSKRAKK